MDRANAEWHPDFMPYCLDAPGHVWKVKPTLEKIDGANCHVLLCSGGERIPAQRILIDPAIGFAMRFREMRQPVEAKDKGHVIPAKEWPLLGRWYFGDFLEAAPDLFLPGRIEVVLYVSARVPREMWNKVTQHQRFLVQEVTVGAAVSDDVFKIDFPPGTVVTDAARGRCYLVGPNGEELDPPLGRGLSDALGPEQISPRRHVVWRWTLWITALVSVCLAALLLWRLYASRRREELRRS